MPISHLLVSGRRTRQSWWMGRHWTWGGKSRAFVLFDPPICCRCIRWRALGLRLEISPAKHHNELRKREDVKKLIRRNCRLPYTALASSQVTEEISMIILYAQCNKNRYFVSDVWICPVGVVTQMRRRRWVRLPCGWHKTSSTEWTKQAVTTEMEQETRGHEKKGW